MYVENNMAYKFQVKIKMNKNFVLLNFDKNPWERQAWS